MKKLKIWHDADAANPFEDWDCEPPLIIEYEWRKDYSEGGITEAILGKMTYGRVIRHQKILAEILDFNLEGLCPDDKVWELQDQIDNADLKALAKICDFFKIPNMQYLSRGHSQSDWSEVLIVLTDEWFERVGADKKDSEEILESTSDLFDNWAWGDVYGFTVYDVKTCDLGCEHEEAEDSCGGFYGDDWENNGIKDHLPEELWDQLDGIEIEY